LSKSYYQTPTGIASYVYCPRLCYINKSFPYSGKKTKYTVIGLFEHEVLAKHAELTRLDWLKVKKLTEKSTDLERQRIDKVLDFAINVSKENYPHFLDVLKNNLDSLRYRLSILDLKRVDEIRKFEEIGSFSEAVDYVLPWKLEEWLVSEKYKIRGRADALYKGYEGTIIVEDIKSHGNRLDAFIHQDEHKAQLTTYAILAEEKYQMPVKQVRILYSQDLSVEEFDISDKDKFDLIKIKKKSDKILESGIPKKLEGEESLKCKHCYRREFCFGLDQRTDDEIRDEVNFEPIGEVWKKEWR
jgi:CRISPR/Cas system-associated exonuclease Cas4 (RecB family)